MPDRLKFGLTGSNGGVTSYPEALVGLAQAAEMAGFDSLWAGEHLLALNRHALPLFSAHERMQRREETLLYVMSGLTG